MNCIFYHNHLLVLLGVTFTFEVSHRLKDAEVRGSITKKHLCLSFVVSHGISYSLVHPASDDIGGKSVQNWHTVINKKNTCYAL